MDRIVFHLLALQTLSCLPEAAATCSDNQKAFGSSCYEFVGLGRSFFGAQDWCEQNGGHLAFIPNEETQYFLQRHLDAERDWWLGVASTSSPNVQDPTTAEGKRAKISNCCMTFCFYQLRQLMGFKQTHFSLTFSCFLYTFH